MRARSCSALGNKPAPDTVPHEGSKRRTGQKRNPASGYAGGRLSSLFFSRSAKRLRPFRRRIDHAVGNHSLQCMRGQPIPATDYISPRVAGAQNVNHRVAHHHRLLRLRARLPHQCPQPLRIRLLRRKTVPAINLEEVGTQPQRVANPPSRIHRLIRQHRKHPLAGIGRVRRHSFCRRFRIRV